MEKYAQDIYNLRMIFSNEMTIFMSSSDPCISSIAKKRLDMLESSYYNILVNIPWFVFNKNCLEGIISKSIKEPPSEYIKAKIYVLTSILSYKY